MESNDFMSDKETNSDENQGSRASKRIRKPSLVFQPEFPHSKSKKNEYSISCKILKSKGVRVEQKNVDFPVPSNFSALSLCSRAMKAMGISNSNCVFAYFCEEKKSNSYSEWKKLKSSQLFSEGLIHKIRIYKKKKMENKHKDVIKYTPQRKMAENERNMQNQNFMAMQDIMLQNMNWYYYCMSMNMAYMFNLQ